MEHVAEEDSNSESEQSSVVSKHNKSIKKNKEYCKKEKQPHSQHYRHTQVAKYLQTNRRLSALGLYPRIGQFLKESINQYYVEQISEGDKQILQNQIQQSVSVSHILKSNKIWNKSMTEQESLNYCSLLQQTNHIDQSVIVIKRQFKYFIISGHFEDEDINISQINDLQATILIQRFKNAPNLTNLTSAYNQKNLKQKHLSDLNFQILLLYNIFKQNQHLVQKAVTQLKQRIQKQTHKRPKTNQNYYIQLLINKNLKKAFDTSPIDMFNYFQKAQNQENPDEDQGKSISLKKDFQEFIKKKRKRKGNKMRSVLKTACLGCFSPYYEQYNPFKICPQCHIRFHQLCYSLTSQSICDLCLHKKNNLSIKAKIQCFICPLRSLLFKQIDENRSIHVFCMLVNKLWKLSNQSLQFEQPLIKPNKNTCDICNYIGQYVYKCQQSSCRKYAHPSCAFLNGWEMCYEDTIKIRCCKNVNLGQNERKRRFILNHKKYVWSFIDKP